MARSFGPPAQHSLREARGWMRSKPIAIASLPVLHALEFVVT